MGVDYDPKQIELLIELSTEILKKNPDISPTNIIGHSDISPRQKSDPGSYASASAYGHTGWTGTVTVIDPEHDLAIILLTNARHSEIEGGEKDYQFKGKRFETGKYGSVISLVYEAILDSF